MDHETYVYTVSEDMENSSWWSSPNEAVADAYEEFDVGDYIFRGKAVYATAADFVNVEAIIEGIQEQAWEDFDELADCYPEVTDAAKLELKGLLIDWLNKHSPPNLFYVQDAVPYELKEEDLK